MTNICPATGEPHKYAWRISELDLGGDPAGWYCVECLAPTSEDYDDYDGPV